MSKPISKMMWAVLKNGKLYEVYSSKSFAKWDMELHASHCAKQASWEIRRCHVEVLP